MTDQQENPRLQRKLLPYQEKFVEAYFADSGSRVHRLIAPAGSGKTTTVLALASRLLSQNDSARVLILSEPKVAALQHESALRDWGIDSVLMDSFKYRELEDVEGGGSSPWEERRVYVSTIPFLARKETSESLFSTSWDLVIIDWEVREGTRNSQFISRLVDQQEVQSVVVISRIAGPESDSFFPDGTKLIDWKMSDLLSGDGKSIWQPRQIRVETIPYQLTDLEDTIREDLASIAALAKNFGKGCPKLELSAALIGDSDLYSVERRLRSFYGSLRQFRNEVAHGKPGSEAYEFDFALFEEISQKIERLFGLIEELETDSKIEVVTHRLKEMAEVESRIIITTRYRATAEYLVSSLEASFDNLWMLTASESLTERETSMRSFAEKGGLLIATEAMLEGCDFSDVDVLLAYDAPRTQEKAQMLIGRFLRIGREKELTVLVPLVKDSISGDDSLALSVIQQALRRFDGLEEGGASSR